MRGVNGVTTLARTAPVREALERLPTVPMKNATLTIDGMTCSGCVASVNRVLGRVPGVSELKVEIGKASLSFDEAQVDEAQLRQVISRAGFETRSFESQ